MIKAIIFDFDGVIGDTYQINYQIAQLFDHKVTEQDFIDHHKGNVFTEPKIKFKQTDIPLFFQKQKERFAPRHLFSLAEIFAKLVKKYQLFIISSTIDANIKYFLKLGHYDRFFQQVLGATTHKSKVEKFKLVFNQYHLKPTECFFVTDTTGDILAARKVNVKTIAVTWGYHNKDLLLSQKPFAIVDSTAELLAVIDKKDIVEGA